MKKADLHLLSLPVGEFLRSRSGGHLPAPVTVKATDKISFVIEALLSHRIHRVFVVDADMKPVSVISLSDILLHFFSSNMGAWYPADDK